MKHQTSHFQELSLARLGSAGLGSSLGLWTGWSVLPRYDLIEFILGIIVESFDGVLRIVILVLRTNC
ncbi:uncharacterized protein BDV14DRAFT_168408 [Aspergillus stella-maris]|uniref:uncharacterized protein n=1 Tax=Aspergillus stella-maris TaxID=1810926 RepID=UPI003CCD7055